MGICLPGSTLWICSPLCPVGGTPLDKSCVANAEASHVVLGQGFRMCFSLKETRFNLNVWRSQEQHDASRVVRQGKDASLMGSSFKNCEVPAARELCRLLHHTAWSLLCFRHVYMPAPSKFSIDTKHDVLKICISLSIWPFWVCMLNFEEYLFLWALIPRDRH